MEILEKRLLQLKGSTATNGAGADAEGGETALSLAAAAKSRHTGGFVSSRPRKKGFDKSQDKSLGGITHLIPITKIGPETIP